jgi:hypothetical protein
LRQGFRLILFSSNLLPFTDKGSQRQEAKYYQGQNTDQPNAYILSIAEDTVDIGIIDKTLFVKRYESSWWWGNTDLGCKAISKVF